MTSGLIGKRDEGAAPVPEAALPFATLLFGDSKLKSLDLREATRLMRKRFRLIARLAALGGLVGGLLAFSLAPLYQAVTILMLDQRQTKVVEQGPVVSNLPMESAALRSEMNIISSRAIIDRVIDKLDLTHDAEFAPNVSRSWTSPSTWFQRAPAATDEEQKARDKAETAALVEKRLDVQNDGHSYSINLSFSSHDPHKAASIANAFADAYIVDQLEAKYDATARANKWLSERLTGLRKDVEISEKAVEEFRQKSNLLLIDGTTVAARQMDEINSQLTAARGQTSQAQARLRSAQAMMREHGTIDSSLDVLSSQLIQRLHEQEAEVRRREAEMASRYGDKHPKMLNVQAELVDINRKIAEEGRKVIQSLENEVVVAKAKDDQLEKSMKELETRAGADLKSSVMLRQLQREADANRALYESFLGRFKQTSEQQELKLPDVRVIAKADTPITPAFPRKSLFLLVGALIGGLLGVMAAYLTELLDRGYRTQPQIEEGTGLSAVGIIPSLKGVSDRPPEDYVLDKPLSAYSEALRTVRTAIHFSNVDDPPKLVMVTSSIPGEGKTTFCLSLARTLAASGNKILLVDADLRKPRLARLLHLSDPGAGLAALLAGDTSFEAALRQDPDQPALDVLPAVGVAPGAQDLLSSGQMKRLMQEIRARYDLVIIDTSPILAVSDAAMVARLVDTSLFLVQWASTPRDTVTQALKQLSGLSCKIAGIVMAQVNTNELASYGDGYYSKRYHDYYTD